MRGRQEGRVWPAGWNVTDARCLVFGGTRLVKERQRGKEEQRSKVCVCEREGEREREREREREKERIV